MATIEIEGKKYKVTETIRKSASNAETVKFVSTPYGERVAVMRGGAWVWRPIADKLQPRGSYVGMSNKNLVAPRVTELLNAVEIVEGGAK